MKLQTIIGKLSGKMTSKDRDAIYNKLYSLHSETDLEAFEYIRSKFILSLNKNFWTCITVKNINDPLSFYQFLSENGYVIKDSKITMEEGK